VRLIRIIYSKQKTVMQTSVHAICFLLKGNKICSICVDLTHTTWWRTAP